MSRQPIRRLVRQVPVQETVRTGAQTLPDRVRRRDHAGMVGRYHPAQRQRQEARIDSAATQVFGQGA